MITYDELITLANQRPLHKAARMVNDWVNKNINYILPVGEGNFNRWSAPERTVAVGKGTCLDYATLKMETLVRAGHDQRYFHILRSDDHAVMQFWYTRPARKFLCFTKPAKLETVILDNNSPYYYKYSHSQRQWKGDPITYAEMLQFVDFDRAWYANYDKNPSFTVG